MSESYPIVRKWSRFTLALTIDPGTSIGLRSVGSFFWGRRMVWFLSRFCGRLFGGGVRLLFTTDDARGSQLGIGIRREFAGAADTNQDSTVADPVSQIAELRFLRTPFYSAKPGRRGGSAH